MGPTGVRFVPGIIQVESYTRLLQLIVITLAIALWLPNAQQMLSAYAPALEEPPRPGWFGSSWAGSGIVLRRRLLLVVRSFYVAAPSPFLYFNF